jgi:predicted dinucleotide-binding enzyme
MTTSPATRPTRIGVLGSGRMADVLVPLWIAAGYDVMIGGRDLDKAAALAARHGARAGTLLQAATYSDVAVLLVLYQGIEATLDEIGTALVGAVIIDATNPVETTRFTLTTPPGTSIARLIADRTGSRVVKALNLVEASVYRDHVRFGGQRLRVPMAGDADAQSVAAPVIAALDVEPIDVGPLEQALHLEAMAAIVIRLLFSGLPSHTAFQLLSGKPA